MRELGNVQFGLRACFWRWEKAKNLEETYTDMARTCKMLQCATVTVGTVEQSVLPSICVTK